MYFEACSEMTTHAPDLKKDYIGIPGYSTQTIIFSCEIKYSPRQSMLITGSLFGCPTNNISGSTASDEPVSCRDSEKLTLA